MKGIRSSINLQRGDVHASRTRWGCQRCWACFRCAGAQRAGVSTLSELCWCSKTRPSWETTWSWRRESSCSLRYNVVGGDDECDKCSLRIRINEPASTFQSRFENILPAKLCVKSASLAQNCWLGAGWLDLCIFFFSFLLTRGWLAWLVPIFFLFLPTGSPFRKKYKKQGLKMQPFWTSFVKNEILAHSTEYISTCQGAT